MNSSFLTLHVYADGCVQQDIDRAGRFLATVGADYYNLTTCARYNEAESLIRTLRRMAPKARPLWRGYPSEALEDGGIWQRTKPQEWVNYRIIPNAAWLRELDVVVVTCNEVGVLGKDAETYAQWEADSTRLSFLQSGVHLGILRLSTGNPLETEHGRYNAALQAASEYGAILTPNEYTARKGEIVTNWHVGRYRWMWKQQDLKGWKRSPIVIGEYGITKLTADNKPDPYKGYSADQVNVDEHISIIERDGQIYRQDGTSAAWFVFGRWNRAGGTFDVQNNEPLLSAVEKVAQQGKLAFKTAPIVPPPPVVIPPTVPPAPPDVPTDPDSADTIPVIPATPPELPPDTSFTPVFEALIAMPPVTINKDAIPYWQAMADNLIIEARVKLARAQWIKSNIERA